MAIQLAIQNIMHEAIQNIIISNSVALAVRGHAQGQRHPKSKSHAGMLLVPFLNTLGFFVWHSGPRVGAWRGPWAAHLQQKRSCSPGSKAGLRSALVWGLATQNAYTFLEALLLCLRLALLRVSLCLRCMSWPQLYDRPRGRCRLGLSTGSQFFIDPQFH